MKRRSFLSAVVAGSAGLSGCAGLFGGGDTDRDQYGVPERSTTETPTETPRSDEDPASEELSRVVEFEHVPRTIATTGFRAVSRPGIGIRSGFSRTGTADHPPTFVTRVTNERDVPAAVSPIELPGVPQWLAEVEPATGPTTDRRVTGTTGTHPSLALVPIDRNDVADVRPELVREGSYWRLADIFSPGVEGPLRVEPGGSIVATFAVVGGPRTVRRPPGTYQFDSYENGVSFAVWNTERPGPRWESRFAGESVPPPSDRTVRWFHEADPSTRVYVEPSTERTTLPGLVDFHLFNRSTEDPGCGGWGLFKRHDGEWFRINPRSAYLGSVCRLVTPGSTVEWSLRAYHGDPVPSEDEGLAVGHLGGGRYAITAGYGDGTDATGALFEVEAPPVAIGSDGDVTKVRDGPEVRIEGDLAPHQDPAATVALTRTDADPTERLIAEQLLQPRNWGLRNALAFFEPGVESVAFRAAERPPVARSSFETTPKRIAFEGRTYEVSVETDDRSS